MTEQLHCKQLHREQSLSSPSPERLAAWRTFLETSVWLLDLLDREMQRNAGIPIRWYDVLVHLEDAPEGMRMNELAREIVTSKSGLTRVIDGMEEAGLVRRIRPEGDRRVILVALTDAGVALMEQARRHHRHTLEEHFSRHLTDAETQTLTRALGKVRAALRDTRP